MSIDAQSPPLPYKRLANARRQPAARRGSTLIEQVAVMALTGLVLATGVASGAHLLDDAWVRNAARDVRDLLALAREQASASGKRTAVSLDQQAGRVVVHAGSDTITRYDVRAHGGVRFTTTRDSMAYAPSGLGYGAANLRIVLTKGRSSDTITVSRLGRVRQ